MLPPNKPISGMDDEKRVGSDSGSGRPSRSPKRDFRKVAERDSRGDSEQNERNVKQKDTEDKDSVFELAGKGKAGKGKTSNAKQGEDLFGLAAAESEENAHTLVDPDAGDELAGLSVKPKSEEEPSVAKGRDVTQLRNDLNVLNPNAMLGKEAQLEGVNLNAAPQPTAKTDLYALVDQISSKLYTVKMGDVTDSVLTIKNPPVFAGSELTVTSYDTAKGEFNIAFSGLTQEAKALIDSQQSRLMQALEERGYVAHIVVTSTEPREITLAQAESSQLGRQGQQKQDQEQQDRNSQDDESR
ncbi:MAG: hypothetical protein CMI02_13710 [Oceanospirillaceae bacterium]|nr:hypothetical protein [Oceanospirillaceae bacterium]